MSVDVTAYDENNILHFLFNQDQMNFINPGFEVTQRSVSTRNEEKQLYHLRTKLCLNHHRFGLDGL